MHFDLLFISIYNLIQFQNITMVVVVVVCCLPEAINQCRAE